MLSHPAYGEFLEVEKKSILRQLALAALNPDGSDCPAVPIAEFTDCPASLSALRVLVWSGLARDISVAVELRRDEALGLHNSDFRTSQTTTSFTEDSRFVITQTGLRMLQYATRRARFD